MSAERRVLGQNQGIITRDRCEGEPGDEGIAVTVYCKPGVKKGINGLPNTYWLPNFFPTSLFDNPEGTTSIPLRFVPYTNRDLKENKESCIPFLRIGQSDSNQQGRLKFQQSSSYGFVFETFTVSPQTVKQLVNDLSDLQTTYQETLLALKKETSSAYRYPPHVACYAIGAFSAGRDFSRNVQKELGELMREFYKKGDNSIFTKGLLETIDQMMKEKAQVAKQWLDFRKYIIGETEMSEGWSADTATVTGQVRELVGRLTGEKLVPYKDRLILFDESKLAALTRHCPVAAENPIIDSQHRGWLGSNLSQIVYQLTKEGFSLDYYRVPPYGSRYDIVHRYHDDESLRLYLGCLTENSTKRKQWFLYAGPSPLVSSRLPKYLKDAKETAV